MSQGGVFQGGAGCPGEQPKTNRPPVTESTPEVCPERENLTFLRMLPVQDSGGELLFWATDDQARELLRNGEVEILWGGKKPRALRVVDEQAMTQFFGWGNESGRHYSHDHETDTNPHGCWTLTRVPRSTRRIFGAVLTSVTTTKAA